MCELPQSHAQRRLRLHRANSGAAMKLSKRAAGLFCLVLPLSFFGCAGDNPKTSATPNQSASLPGQLPANPLQWKVITSMADHADSTMSTLYGNDVATG